MKWVRPTISLIAVLGITVGFFMGMVTAEAYVPLMAVAVTWWFKSRDEAKRVENGVQDGTSNGTNSRIPGSR